MKPKLPWKRNILKVPDALLAKARALPKGLVAGVVLRIPRQQIVDGLFNHLGLVLSGDQLVVPKERRPDPAAGRWSLRNVEGYEVRRTDLPMISKTFSVEAPDWGDSSNGTHEVLWDRDVYRRDFYPPKGLNLELELLGYEPTKDTFVVRCSTDEVLSPTAPDLEAALLYNLNVLQENVGRIDVHAATATREDYLKTLFVAWEILPPGEREKNINIILGNDGEASPEVRARLVERYRLLEKMRPVAFIAGTSGFDRYFGAKYADDLVVFENVEYGNAAYIMGANWETLSRMSRTELISRADRDFARIPHTTNWQTRLVDEIDRRKSAPAAAATKK